ncbi:hypothetical protein [Aquimarina sp. AU474]|nr:hypothetical protein [Aquimarina sp. AU474]
MKHTSTHNEPRLLLTQYDSRWINKISISDWTIVGYIESFT